MELQRHRGHRENQTGAGERAAPARSSRLSFLTCLLCVLCASVVSSPRALAAAPAKVTVQADRKEAQVGQPILVTVRVRGALDTPTVKPPAVKDAEIAPVGQPRSVPSLAADLEASGVFHAGGAGRAADLIRGLGQMPNPAANDPDLAKLLGDTNPLNANDYFFTYQVTPQHSGPLAVPAFAVSIGGQSANTPPLSINVTEAKPQPWVQMRLSLSDPTPEVGAEVQLYVDLLIRRGQVTYAGKTYPYLPVSKVSLILPPLDGAREFEPVRPLDKLLQENAVEPGKHGFRVNNFPAEVKMDHEPADAQGADLDPARYRRRLAIPLRVKEAGQVTLAAAHAAGEVYVVGGDNKGRWEPFVAASEPLTFGVLDLHRRADRPPDFTGAVGEVRVTAKASQTEMPAGTPFTLTVRLDGSGSVTSTGAPDLAARPEFAGRFKVRHEETHTVGGGARQFAYTLRPLSADVTEVPPVPVTYFDPKANKFGTARSEPIPLHVTAAPNATPNVPAAAPPPPEPADRPEPAPASGLDALVPWLEGAMVVALAACAAVWAVRRLRRHPRPLARPAPASAAPAPRLAPLAPAPTFAAVRETLQDFLRRHFRLPPGEVTPGDAEQCLRRGGVPEGLARSFAALLDTCETAEFAPGVVPTSPADLAAYGRQLMDQVIAAIPEVVV